MPLFYKMLKLYALFHCNLAFSMVPSAHYPTIIEKCYRPLLSMAVGGLKIAIEMSACTLKIVNRLDPAFVTELKELWMAGKCEFIGSGYSQAIFPLIPATVNRWNLETGCRVYKELLGHNPKTALVNEQTYSKGLVDLYTEAGYETIIMDWNNCFLHNKYAETGKYTPQKTAGFKTEINVIWSNSIAFQKFQRTIHSEVEENDYMKYLFGQYKEGVNRSSVIYCNDAEVFDYRPGKEVDIEGEYDSVRQLLKRITEDKRAMLLTPAAIIDAFKAKSEALKPLLLESVEMPVVTKKQGKYNPVRWAATGRDSVHINTECYKVFNKISTIIAADVLPEKDVEKMKEKLCEIWGSDFRTNTIDEKFLYFHELLGGLKVETERIFKEFTLTSLSSGVDAFVKEASTPLAFPKAKTVSTGTVLKVSTGAVVAEFLTNKGLAIKTLTFPTVSPDPLIGTLEHGYYNDMRFGADFFSGHLIHLTKEAKKTVDLKSVTPVVEEDETSVTVSARLTLDICTLWKTYRISKVEQKVELSYRMKVNGLVASSLRLGIFTALPSAFDFDSLWIESVNGGTEPERFYLAGHTVSHDQPPCPGVTASACLGATDGVVTVGDSKKSISFFADKSTLYSVPMVNCTGVDETFFLRIYHSIGEVDDTAWWVWRGYNEAAFTITAQKIK